MDHDERLLDYNPTLVVSAFGPPKNFTDYAHLEKKILIHQLPLENQKYLLKKALILNDENYIYEFDKEALNIREKCLSRGLALVLSCSGYYSFSAYFYLKKMKRNRIKMKKEFRFIFLLMANVLPLFYFYYQGNKLYSELDQFLYKKYLYKSL